MCQNVGFGAQPRDMDHFGCTTLHACTCINRNVAGSRTKSCMLVRGLSNYFLKAMLVGRKCVPKKCISACFGAHLHLWDFFFRFYCIIDECVAASLSPLSLGQPVPLLLQIRAMLKLLGDIPGEYKSHKWRTSKRRTHSSTWHVHTRPQHETRHTKPQHTTQQHKQQ